LRSANEKGKKFVVLPQTERECGVCPIVEGSKFARGGEARDIEKNVNDLGLAEKVSAERRDDAQHLRAADERG